MPSRSDSSRRSEIPSSLRSFTSSAMRSTSRDLFTWYGISVTMIAERPLFSSVSISALALAVGVANGRLPADEASGRKVGTRDEAHEVVECELRVLDQGHERVTDLAE